MATVGAETRKQISIIHTCTGTIPVAICAPCKIALGRAMKKYSDQYSGYKIDKATIQSKVISEGFNEDINEEQLSKSCTADVVKED